MIRMRPTFKTSVQNQICFIFQKYKSGWNPTIFVHGKRQRDASLPYSVKIPGSEVKKVQFTAKKRNKEKAQ